MTNLNIKRGDTFYAAATYRDALGEPASLDGVTIKAELYDTRHNRQHTFATTVLDEAIGTYEFDAFDTSALPISQYWLELTYTKNGIVTSAFNLGLKVIKQHLQTPQRHARLTSRTGLTSLLINPQTSLLNISSLNTVWDVQWDVDWTE